MKTRHLLLLALAVATIASCNHEKPGDEENPGTGTETSALKVTLPSSGPLSVYRWSAVDKIRVGDGVFNLKEGAGTETATFNGTPAQDSYYTIAYPADIRNVDTYMAYSLVGQTQTGNGSTGHLIWTALIEDANTWEDITLSPEWAASKSGTFRSNGVVALDLTLPSDIGTLKSITLESSGVKFPVNNSGTDTADELVLGLSNVPASSPVKAYLAVSAREVDLEAGTLRLTVEGDITYNMLLPEAVKMGGGLLTQITVSDASGWSSTPVLRGNGSEASPYILSAPEHIEMMSTLLVEDQTVWFELDADIDMSYIAAWDPLNIIAPYNLAVHFDGKGHTISNFKCDSGIYPSFFGVLNGTVQNVVFDNANIEGSGKTGVVAGYLGTSLDGGVFVTGNAIGVTVKNSTVKADNYAGCIAGQVNSPATISDCHVKDVVVTSTLERVGGLIGQAGVSSSDVGAKIQNCTAENVTAEAQKNVGGLIGVCYCTVTGCTSSGRLTSNLANSKEVSVGGLIGHVENTTVSDCSSSAVVELTLQGRSIGGFVGTFKGSRIERCYATGEVIGTYRNNGGFVGLIQTSSIAGSIENCYCTGHVTGQSYTGGFVGLMDNTKNAAVVKNCYASGDVIGSSFDIGGFVGHDGCALLEVINCAAWAKTVTAGVFGAANWSSGAFCAVTFPTATFTGNYRNPEMALTAYWVPAADYDHADVSPATPLIKQDGTPSTATALASGQDGYPQFAYHGHVAPGKTLSQLASTTLGWDATVWNFSGELPVLK